MRYRNIGLFAALYIAMPFSVSAGGLTSQIDVTLTITASCVISTSPLAFGRIPDSAVNIKNKTAAVKVQCAQNSPYSISLDGGRAGDVSRNMRGQSEPSARVAYELYSDPGYLTPWGANDDYGSAKIAQGTGLIQIHTIYAMVPDLNVVGQDYKDTITATIAW